MNYIFEISLNNLIDLSKDKYGSRVIESIIDTYKAAQINMNSIIKKISDNFYNIIDNESGRYVIKYILLNCQTDKNINEIYQKLIENDNVVNYSKNKNLVYVINVALLKGDIEKSKLIINKIVKENNMETILDLGNHKYGNFVVQTIIDIIGQYNKDIEKNIISTIKKAPDGKYMQYVKKHILEKSCKKFEREEISKTI